MDRSRVALGGVLVGVAGAIGAGVVAPGRVRSTVAHAQELFVVGLRQVPEPILVAGALMLAVVLWYVAVRYLLIVLYRAWRRISARLYQLLTLVLPESPLVKFAAGSMVLIAVFIVIVGGLPALIGNLSEADQGAASYVNRIGADELNSGWTDIVDGDAAEGEPACDGTVAPTASGATDRDGDGLPDAWERAGETPGGAALPDADPGRKDLFVQVNYGADVSALTDPEREQLCESWAEMPVENPDGSTGVTLHLDEGSAGAGDLGETAVVTTLEERSAFYSDERLGPRRCVYRQVVYGKVDVGTLAVAASMPGYAAAVDGSRQPNYDGSVSFRVAMTNHALLHTAVGPVEEGTHTSEGWLAGGPDDEYLSAAAASDLNETGIHGPAG